MGTTERLNEILREKYDELHGAGDVEISPAKLATFAYLIIDPEHVAPMLVEGAAILELRQLARSICATRDRDQANETEQMSMFDMQLQPRYPARRGEEDVYVLRSCLTEEERRHNSARLRKESEAKNRHADALDAETDDLLMRGVLALESECAK